MIPRIIIQTGPPDLPVILKSAIVTVKSLNPGFDYIFFSDAEVEDFIHRQFPEYEEACNSFRFPIQKYDLFRYLAVYHFGGFYLDLDVFLAQELTPLLTCDCVFPFEELTSMKYFWREFRMDWQVGNYAFGAVPRHPYVGAIIKNCLQAKVDPSWVKPMMAGIPRLFRSRYYVTSTTGPGLVSRTFAENPSLAKDVKVLFPDDVTDPRSWYQFGSYGIHSMVGSWRNSETVLTRRLARIWEDWTLRRVLADGRSRGKTRALESVLGSTVQG